MLKIENEYICARIECTGAELVSLVDKSTGREYIWQADKTVWARHAPILFPAVGRMAGDMFIHGGNQYYMQKHGFARNSSFEIISSDKTSIVLRLTSSDTTRKIFPFEFELDVYFSVSDKALTQKYAVRNIGSDTMYFSLGMHPGLICRQDDILRFEKKETAKLPYLNGSDTVGNPDDFLMLRNENEIVLSKELFERGSLALEAPLSQSAELCDRDGKPYLRESFGKIPMLWLWSKPGAEFVCVEPWFGSDERYPQNVLAKKKGIVPLDFGKTFEFPMTLQIL